jgi:hypothetical protein
MTAGNRAHSLTGLYTVPADGAHRAVWLSIGGCQGGGHPQQLAPQEHVVSLGVLLPFRVLDPISNFRILVGQRKIEAGCRVAARNESIAVLDVAPRAATTNTQNLVSGIRSAEREKFFTQLLIR